MKAIPLLVTAVLFSVGCATTPPPTSTPIAAPTAVPTTVPRPTQAPTNSPLPPTPTTAPSPTATLPPTNTPIPSSPTPTATNTRAPITRQPPAAATAAATQVTLQYGAPELIEPSAGDTRTAGQSDLVFKWKPIATLGTNECYALTLRVKNMVDPLAEHYGQETYFVADSCNSGGDDPIQFVVKRRAPAPDYVGLMAQADALAGNIPSQEYLVTWTVQVVLFQDGTLIPLSPPSAIGEFRLLNP